MERKIRGFRRGVFQYDRPAVIVLQNGEETDCLTFRVQTGQTYEGSFLIANEQGTEIRGLIEQESRETELKLAETMFQGRQNTIRFSFLAEESFRLGRHKSMLSVVSDCGIRKIPVELQICRPFVRIENREVNDWKEFARLARTDWQTAASLFASEEFPRVFLYEQKEWIPLYNALIRGSSTGQAMEEFLVAAGLKEPLRYEIEAAPFRYEAGEEPFEDEIKISKSNWGTGEIAVSVEGEFLSTEQKLIRAEHFFQKEYALRFRVDPGKAGPGLHLGRIRLEMPKRTVSIPVTLHRESSEETKQNRRFQKHYISVEKHYLEFRLNQITREEYVHQTAKALGAISDIREDETADLLEIHINLVAGRQSYVEKMLEILDKKADMLSKYKPIHYCGYRYLKAMFQQRDDVTKEAAELISDYYTLHYPHPLLLWFLFQLDGRYGEEPERKLREIRKLFRNGTVSPVLYYEAAAVYNANPYMLNKPDQFEMQIMNWSLKHGFLRKEAAMQYCYLIGRAKQVNALMIRNLEKLYGEYQDQEVLQILCSVLLSSRRVERKYFRWFAMGVERGLKINGLHEAYMDTVPEEQTTPYDASVYTYFSFDCRLSDRKRALLYSNILQNSRLLPDVAAQYRREITVFTKEMFDKKAMNEFLPVLYRKLYEENQGNRRIVAGLAKLQDRCRITTSYERMRQVIAADESGEHTMPLLQGEAWISLQKENHILLEDKNGVRYGDASYYNITRPFELPGLDEQSMEGQQITLNLPKAVRLPKPVLTVEEKIVRALFTEEGIDRILPDFLNYAAGKCDRKLVKSFLCYYSFRYLYYNNGGNEELFRLLWKEVLYEENEVGRMALLKWMSRKGELTREESQAAGKWIEEFYAMGIILPFFKQLEGRAELPYGISKRYYIEYHANPSRRITVHYSIGKMGEVTEELMPHCYKGIFVKEFILFQDEELYYYITEEGQEETDPKLWKLEPDPYEGEEEISLYGLLNLLAYAREQGDAEQVKSLVEDYHAMRQVLQEKFKII